MKTLVRPELCGYGVDEARPDAPAGGGSPQWWMMGVALPDRPSSDRSGQPLGGPPRLPGGACLPCACPHPLGATSSLIGGMRHSSYRCASDVTRSTLRQIHTATVGPMGATLRESRYSLPPHVEPDADPAREARLDGLLRAWWREERPAWTEGSWWDTTLHEDVRRLLWLAPDPRVATALAGPAPAGPCPMPHADEMMLPDWPTPGHAPGWPCACQIVTAAAWEACASWLDVQSAAALVTAASAEEVEFDVGEGRQRIHDPAREELAHALRTSIPATPDPSGFD